MLYLGICDLCGFLLIAEDILAFKQEIAAHFDISHGVHVISEIRLDEFKNITIFRIRDEQKMAMVKESVKNPTFWHTFRNRYVLAEAMVQ